MRPSRIVFLLIALTACRPTPPRLEPPANPRLSVHAPERYRYHPYRKPLFAFSVRGENLDPQSTRAVALRVEDERGNAVPVVFDALTIQDVVWGESDLTLDLASLRAGTYRVCASAEGVPGGCATFALDIASLTPCETQIAEIVKQGAQWCRCVKAEIRTSGPPDGSLGKLTDLAGGNTLGPVDEGNALRTLRFTSAFKFEAHFTVDVSAAPAAPPGCPPEEWTEGLIALCKEGQRINSTDHIWIGLPYEQKRYKNRETPYDPRPEAKFRDDGYHHPADANDPDLVDGLKKAHDLPNIIHWIDGPGLYGASSATYRGLLGIRTDRYIHAYVHGDPSSDANDCDCYFTIRSGRLQSNGDAGTSTIEGVVCR